MVRDAIIRVGGRLQPAVLEIHGAMDYQFTKLINQICQRAKVFRGYSASYFRRFCYETVGHALFKGQYDRCLNKATSEGQSRRPEEAWQTVTCTDDLGVTLSHAEAEVLHEQSISSLVRTEFIRGRRIFRRMGCSQEADGFLTNVLGSPGRRSSGRPTGGSARLRRGRSAGQDRCPVVSRGPSHTLRTSSLSLQQVN